MSCVDLRTLAGKRYRLARDESYLAEGGSIARAVDPWLLTIPCQRGHIFPWGSDKLAASTDRRGPTAGILADLAFTSVVQDGDDGITVTFPEERFSKIAKIMKPRRRRRLSPEERRKAGDRVAKYRFGDAVRAPENRAKSTQTLAVGV